MNAVTKALAKAARTFHRPGANRTCPICMWSGERFEAHGIPPKVRFDARCPRCRSMERHRLAFMVATELAELDYASVLHVAPEGSLSNFIQSRAGNYLSIDLAPGAMEQMDVTRLKLPDASCTLVWISHVMEHVEEDEKAIAEMHRVLKRGGKAFVQVPIWREKTYEDFGKRSPRERKEAFYQDDHVRLYGMDVVDKFAAVGFSPKIYRAQDFRPEVLLRHSLSFASTNEVFVFTKGADDGRGENQPGWQVP